MVRLTTALHTVAECAANSKAATSWLWAPLPGVVLIALLLQLITLPVLLVLVVLVGLVVVAMELLLQLLLIKLVLPLATQSVVLQIPIPPPQQQGWDCGTISMI